MQGIAILTHAVGMVIANWGIALRISGLLMAAQMALALGLGLQHSYLPLAPDDQAAAFPMGIALLMVFQLFSAFWITIAWHRFILRSEIPAGSLPPLNGRVLLRYVGVGLLLALMLVLVAIPLGVAAAFIVGPATLASPDGGGFAAVIILMALVWLPVTYLGYRLSPVLPAAALGERLPLKEVWYQTGTSGSSFVVLSLATMLLYLALEYPVSLLATPAPVLAFLWAFLLQWATVLVGASVLTTIYGHYMEDRPLNA
ncbi:MAG: hypothetical protein JJU19_13305 [Pararhodobacter sp.]|nr:hypothetical protein [Pararhodobacter sp.]